MTYKTILVHLDDTEPCGRRLAVATGLALAFRAHLVGIYLVGSREISPSIAALLPPDVVARRLQDTGTAQDRAERAFRATAGAAGLTSFEWRAPAGLPADAAITHGRCADLFVIGQQDPDDAGYGLGADFIPSVLLATGRPTLVVPYVGTPSALGKNVLIAWNGGQEASRAIADALPLLATASLVAVHSVSTGANDRGGEAQAQSRLADYLSHHGITARFEHYELGGQNIGEWLLSRAADMNADLMVLGAYGHARLRELVLGGVTRTLLQSMTVPLLMSH